MLQSVSMARSLKLIFFASPLIVISFLSLTQRILFITKNELCIAKGCVLKGCVRFWFGTRSYPKKLVDNQIRRVLESKSEQLFGSRTKTGIGVSFVVSCHPRFHDLTNTIRKLFIYLYTEEQVK